MKAYIIFNQDNQVFAGMDTTLNKPVWNNLDFGAGQALLITNKKLADAWAFELHDRGIPVTIQSPQG